MSGATEQLMLQQQKLYEAAKDGELEMIDRIWTDFFMNMRNVDWIDGVRYLTDCLYFEESS